MSAMRALYKCLGIFGGFSVQAIRNLLNRMNADGIIAQDKNSITFI